MGLVYSKSESLNLIQAMESNLAKAETILGLLTNASQKLTGVLTNELKGQAYTTGLAVFDDIVLPTLKNASTAIEEFTQGLSNYHAADKEMPNEILDEDNLNEQIRIRRNMIKSLDYQINLLQGNRGSDNLASQTNLLNSLTSHVSTLEEEIRLLQEKLRKLGEFSSRTNGLFSKGSDYLQGVLRGVNVLNHASVAPKTGTYILTGGVSLFDLHVPDVDIAAKAHKISPEFKIKVDGMTHYQLVQTFPYLSTLNPYQFVSDPAEIHRRRYVLSIAEIKRLKEYEHLIPKPQEDDRLTQIYAHIRKTGIDPTTGEPATSYQKWIAKHYSAISTGLSIAQISAGLWAGYRVYKSEVPTDKTAPKVGGDTTQGWNFNNSQKLYLHYTKHGDELKNALSVRNYSVKNYLDDANMVIRTGKYSSELNGYIKFIGYSGKSSKYAFVGVDSNGNITTFHIKPLEVLIKKAPSLGFEK